MKVLEKHGFSEVIEGTAAWYLVEHGKAEGIQEGIEKGIEKKQQEVTQKLLEEGFSLELIMRITDLTEAEIKEIQSMMK